MGAHNSTHYEVGGHTMTQLGDLKVGDEFTFHGNKTVYAVGSARYFGDIDVFQAVRPSGIYLCDYRSPDTEVTPIIKKGTPMDIVWDEKPKRKLVRVESLAQGDVFQTRNGIRYIRASARRKHAVATFSFKEYCIVDISPDEMVEPLRATLTLSHYED